MIHAQQATHSRGGKILIALIALSGVFAFQTANAAPKAAKKGAALNGTAANAEALGAKAFLEDVMAKRYAQELSTTLDRDLFTVGTQLDVKEIPSKAVAVDPTAPAPEPISDLMIGTIDPEELIKKYSNTPAPESAKSFLTNYRITKVSVSVGLHDTVTPEAKASVEKWLSERVKAEFGGAGEGKVNVIQSLPLKKPDPKTTADWLNQFQLLAGLALVAAAFLLGMILFQLLSKSPKTASNGDTNVNVTSAGGTAPTAAGSPEAAAKQKVEQEVAEQERLGAQIEIASFTQKLNELVPRVANDFENIMRSWCQLGDSGKLRLACFAEAVGKEIGRLPIPTDAVADVLKVFAGMSQVSPQDKRDALQKAYWDLLSVINLGVESLNQPFGYLGAMNLGMVNQVLMDQNPKMKTVVSLFMPTDLRTRYMQSLPAETKVELLDAAASLSSIESGELRSLDQGLKTKLKPSGNQNVVPLDMTLKKLVGSLSRIEEATLLEGKTGPAFDEFKRTTASIAFLPQWPDDKMSLLLGRVSPDELVAYCRVRPDLKDRLLAMSPPMTAEIAGDELSRPDGLSEKDKNERLEALARRLNEMASLNEINLEEMFPAAAAATDANNGLKAVA